MTVSKEKSAEYFDCSAKELSELAGLRGRNASDVISSKFGGVSGLCERLKTSSTEGLTASSESLRRRRTQFGLGKVSRARSTTCRSFFCPSWKTLRGIALTLLLLIAILSIGLAFYYKAWSTYALRFGSVNKAAMWEGIFVLLAVVVLIMVAAFNYWWKGRVFRRLRSRAEEEQSFGVMRSGKLVQICRTDLVVGDVYHFKVGDILPAHGVIIKSRDLTVDETPYNDNKTDSVQKGENIDPILVAGSHVEEGHGKMVVTAMSRPLQAESRRTMKRNTRRSQKDDDKEIIRVDDDDDDDDTVTDYLYDYHRAAIASVRQSELITLAKRIGYTGIVIAILTFFVLILYDCVRDFVVWKDHWQHYYIQDFVHFLILALALLVLSAPECLPVAIYISLAYSICNMVRGNKNSMVRNASACETMGNVTTLCIGKIGTLTTGFKNVVQSYICERHNLSAPRHSDLPSEAVELMAQAISCTTSYKARVTAQKSRGTRTRVGSNMDCALLGFLLDLGQDPEAIRKNVPEEKIYKEFSINGIHKSTCTVLNLPNDGFRVLCRGESKGLLKRCQYVFGSGGTIKPLSSTVLESMLSIIKKMKGEGLQTICVAYKDYVQGSSKTNEAHFTSEPNWTDQADVISGLTCVCALAIDKPVGTEVPNAIRQCQREGINVILATGYDIGRAHSIAAKSGILPSNGGYLCLKGKDFNTKIRDQPGHPVQQSLVDNVWPKLRVMARASPDDKYALVKGIRDSRLNGCHEVVAITGSGPKDGPVLRAAHVGIATGSNATCVTKEASDIVLTDESITSIVRAITWGRNLYDNVAKFVQFHMIVYISAVVLAFVGVCALMESPLKAIQLLWICLIMDTLAAHSFANDSPSTGAFNRVVCGGHGPNSLFSCRMCINIVAHVIYQLVVTLCLLFTGEHLCNIDSGRFLNYRVYPTQHITMVFNTFVMMTLFNEINCRRIAGEYNMFQTIYRNIVFILVWIVVFICQIFIITFGGYAFSTARLTVDQWLWCILFGVGELLYGQIITMITSPCCACKNKGIGSLRDFKSQRLNSIAPNEADPDLSKKSSRTKSIEVNNSTQIYQRSSNRLQKPEIGIAEMFANNASKRRSSIASLGEINE